VEGGAGHRLLPFLTHEQAAQMLWLAEHKEDIPSVITNPPLSLSAFFIEGSGDRDNRTTQPFPG